MSTTFATPEVQAWLDQVVEIRERVLADRILTADHPGAQQIIASDEYPFVDNGEHLELYFGDEEHTLETIVFQRFTDLPECPFPMPTWAETRTLLLGDWPEVNLEHKTQFNLSNVGDVMGVSHAVTLMALADTDPEGNEYPQYWVLADDELSFFAGRGLDWVSFSVGDGNELEAFGEQVLRLAQIVNQTPLATENRIIESEPVKS